MSRKQRIIVSITGIVLVSLILIGLTYGYYLTKIKGNTNSKSISVVTANLLLEYADVNDELITDSAVEPGKSWTKTFVATNKGNKTVTYGVALENVVNTLERKEDLVYTLDCKQYSKTGFSIDKTNKTVTGTIFGTCNGVSEETTFPSIGTILVQNDIADDKAQVYTLVVTYKETNTDQSVDMNKTFSAKANIVDPNNFKPYGTNTLATAIIDSAKNATGERTVYRNVPLTKIAEEITGYKTGNKVKETITTSNLCDGYDSWSVGDSETTTKSSVSSYDAAVGKYVYDNCSGWTKKLIKYDSSSKSLTFETDEIISEKTLSKTEDNYGTSYYFRGDVIDNYVNFAGMCWRIVRIEGDGSIKLILASELSCSDTNVTAKSGYATDGAAGVQGTKLQAGYGGVNYIGDYINSTTDARNKLNTWLQTKITSDSDKTLLKNEDWCIGDRTSAYIYNSSTKTYDLSSSTAEELISAETEFYYSARKRIYDDKTPTLVCDGTKQRAGEIDTNKVGMLTIDEIVFAGASINDSNLTYYLYKNAGYYMSWWTLSLSGFRLYSENVFVAYVFNVDSRGGLNTHDYAESSTLLRPVITLLSNTEVSSGDGTVNNAYVVK